MCILGLLRRAESYAFEIARQITAQYEPIVVSQGTVHPLLTRRRRAGLVSSVLRESPTGPARKNYRLTKNGDQVLNELMLQWASCRRYGGDAVAATVGGRTGIDDEPVDEAITDVAVQPVEMAHIPVGHSRRQL